LLTFFFLYELTGDDKFDWLGRAVGEAMTEESGSGSEQTEISVGDELNRYTRQIYALSSAFPFVTTFLTAANQAMSKQHNDYLDKFGEREGDSYTLTPEYSFDFNKIRKKLEGTTTASQIVPRSLLVSLVSIFDSFLGRLIGALYAVKPEMMNSSERSLTFAQLRWKRKVQCFKDFGLDPQKSKSSSCVHGNTYPACFKLSYTFLW
jgi:hypothetical protein